MFSFIRLEIVLVEHKLWFGKGEEEEEGKEVRDRGERER